MIIRADNAEEYIAIRLALCGEIDKDRIQKDAPFSQRSIDRALKSLKDKRVVNKHVYDDGKTYLRFSSVGAPAFLNSISPALLQQAKSVTAPNLLYTGNKGMRMRERCCFELYAEMLESVGSINMISYTYAPNILGTEATGVKISGSSVFKASSIPFFEDTARYVSGTGNLYFTKRVLKKYMETGAARDAGRGSRIAGTIILSKEVYQTYALSKVDGSSWKADSEVSASNYILGCLERNSEAFRETGTKAESQCILFYPSVDEVANMIFKPDGIRTKVEPSMIYGRSLLMPSYRISKSMLKLLSVPAWSDKLSMSLYPDASMNEMGGFVLPNGSEIYNFTGCDLNKMRSSISRIAYSDRTSILIIQDWMRPITEELYGGFNTEIVELNDEAINIIADAISEA